MTLEGWQVFLDVELTRFESAIKETIRRAGASLVGLVVVLWALLELVRTREPTNDQVMDSIFLFGLGGIAGFQVAMFFLSEFAKATGYASKPPRTRFFREDLANEMGRRLHTAHLSLLGVFVLALIYTSNRLDSYSWPIFAWTWFAIVFEVMGLVSKAYKGKKLTEDELGGATQKLEKSGVSKEKIAVWIKVLKVAVFVIAVVLPALSILTRWDTLIEIETIEIALAMLGMVLLSYWCSMMVMGYISFLEMASHINSMRVLLITDPDITDDKLRNQLLDVYPKEFSAVTNEPQKGT